MSGELEAPKGPAAVTKTSGGNAAYHNYHNDFLHIQDPNERRRLALAEIDAAPFGWYHVSYDIFAVSLLTLMLGIVYYPSTGTMPASSDNAIKLATSAGTVIGQLGFGYLADHMYGLELIIIIFATVAQALSSNSPSVDVVGLIIFWRVLMGIGIGGDYPLSSIITSEFATTKWRGAMMGAVFAMQGLGQLCCAIVMLCVTAGFKQSLSESPDTKHCGGDCAIAVDKMWRVVIGFGAVPATIALYYRLTIPETPRYTFDVGRDVEKAADDVKAYMSGKSGGTPDEVSRIQARDAAQTEMQIPKASWSDFIRHFSILKNGLLLLGTAGSWFMLDIIGYSTKNARTYEVLLNTAIGNLIIVLAGAVPGYWVTVATVDTLGRKTIQMMGFIILTILFVVMGFAYNWIAAHNQNGLLVIYVLAQFFFNFGPNATTFIVPGEVFPTRYRSTAHGISAASGKIGSIIGQGAISTLKSRGATKDNDSPWLDHVLQIFALFMLLGCFTTLCIPRPSARRSRSFAVRTSRRRCRRRHMSRSRPSPLKGGRGSARLLST
ncbi:phosphate transport protein [Apiospora marii]|uniref:Phosphate transport protein n=1 Tax=Apiospora marii TaxID=335849 RepID=A0ABR1SI10_9PEZI